MLLKSPAKINLGLTINGCLADGWHDISTVLTTVPIYDELKIGKRDDNKIVITTDNQTVPTDENNFLYIAYDKLREVTKHSEGINIDIKKNIPMGAGLGGGSLNATTLIKYFMSKWKIDTQTTIDIAKETSSDSVFSLIGEVAYEKNHGLRNQALQITALPSLPHMYMVIVWPELFIGIQDAYKEIDKNFKKSNYNIEKLVTAIQNRDLSQITVNIHNDFTEKMISKYNELDELKEDLLETKPLVTCMTGKGSSMYTIFDDKFKHNKAYENLCKKYKYVWKFEVGTK